MKERESGGKGEKKRDKRTVEENEKKGTESKTLISAPLGIRTRHICEVAKRSQA